jgi:O-antigen ligase
MQQNLFRFTGYGAAILLPLALVWLSPIYGLIAWALAIGVDGRWQPKVLPALLFAAFVDWEIISVFWSGDRSAGWADVVMVLPFGLMGVLIHLLEVPNGQRVGRNIARVFAWATAGAWTLTFLYSIATLGWVNYNDFVLGERLGIHFQSLYLVAAALILERRIWSSSKAMAWLTGGTVLWLLLGVVFLSARIHLITVPLLLMVRLFEHYRRNPVSRRKLLLYGGSALLVLGSLVVLLPGPSRRLSDLKNELRSVEEVVDGKQTNHRVFLWKYGREIITEHPWMGTGNGYGEEALHQKLLSCEATFYNKKTPYYLHEFRYDFHNIWIQSWAEGGIVAVFLLLGIFLWGIIKSRGSMKYVWVALLVSGMTESLFEKQAGIFFLAFVVALTALSTQTSANPSGKNEAPANPHQ